MQTLQFRDEEMPCSHYYALTGHNCIAVQGIFYAQINCCGLLHYSSLHYFIACEAAEKRKVKKVLYKCKSFGLPFILIGFLGFFKLDHVIQSFCSSPLPWFPWIQSILISLEQCNLPAWCIVSQSNIIHAVQMYSYSN